MDELAHRYVLLVLRLARHRPDLIASYIGSAELREAIDGEQPTLLVELHDEALRLGEFVSEEPSTPRTRWLSAQLRALAAVARTLAGEEIGYLDLVEEMYGTPLSPEPEGTFRAAHAMLDAALPPGESLSARLAAYRAATRLPADVAVVAAERLIDLLRRRTAEDVWLPAGEATEITFVDGDGTHLQYLGAAHSRIEAGDSLLTIGGLVTIASHHAYPGHHAERATKEAMLLRRRGWSEASVACRFTPEELVSEGIASVGREVVLTDQELAAELGRIGRSTGITVEPQRELAIGRAVEHLAPAVANAAILMHHDGLPLEQVRRYLTDVALVEDGAVGTCLEMLRDPLRRCEPVTAFAGLRLLREWLQVHGQTQGLARALAEPLTPGDLAMTDA